VKPPEDVLALPLDEHQRIVSVLIVLHLRKHFSRPIGDNKLDLEHLRAVHKSVITRITSLLALV